MLLTGNKVFFKSQKGFTLIEILIVLVIMGLSLSIIAPSMANYMESAGVKTQQRKIMNLFNQVRKQAITSNRKQIIEITSNGFKYVSNQEEEHLLEIDFSISYIDDIEESGIVYFSDGTSNGRILLLENTDSSEQYEMRIDELDGDITWSEMR
ncbi:MAG: pilus assembly FimT family protein [Bacillota bacterium]